MASSHLVSDDIHSNAYFKARATVGGASCLCLSLANHHLHQSKVVFSIPHSKLYPIATIQLINTQYCYPWPDITRPAEHYADKTKLHYSKEPPAPAPPEEMIS